MTDQNQTTPPNPRQTFIDATNALSDQFMADALLRIPELAGLMVVPVWGVEAPQAPVVITRVPAGVHSMADFLRMERGLLAAIQALHPRLVQMLTRFDQEAARIAAEIRDGQAELAARAPRAGEEAAQPADPPGHPG